ncbi:Thioredoxin-related transmembrane protein 2 [Nymphon striatum]|nr:Thioredoxin-related transmembrane protein 2 [Nymphon striatum]
MRINMGKLKMEIQIVRAEVEEVSDSEILFFVIIVVVFKTKRKGVTSLLSYLSSLFMYVKVANVMLFFMTDPRLCILYIIVCLIQLFVFPEPTYSGPEAIVYFNDQHFEEEIEADKRIVWIIAFYAMWSPVCIDFAPIFSELSAKYSLENLKFGKIDVGRYPSIAEKYKINCSSLSKQLPTVSIFKNGKIYERKPMVDSKSRLVKFVFSLDNMISGFDLNNLHQECKKITLKKKKSSDKKEN